MLALAICPRPREKQISCVRSIAEVAVSIEFSNEPKEIGRSGRQNGNGIVGGSEYSTTSTTLWETFLAFVEIYYVTGLGITMGAHRLWAKLHSTILLTK